jgi:cytochrome P450
VELNPFSFEFHQDPYPTYRWLRDEAPCYQNEELGFWALTRYTDVLAASHDWETYSSADGPMIEKTPREFVNALPMMISMDPPRQAELRGLVNRVFTPRRVNALEPTIRAVAARYLDELRESGGGDFVTGFSALLPMDVIFTLLGVPEADRRAIRALMDMSLDRDQDSNLIPERAMKAMGEAVAWWFGRVAELRARPGDDLVSALIEADVDGVRLTDHEVVGFCSLIGAAGTETVTKLLANACVLLARHPDARRRLAADASCIPPAAEEVLRYWAPSQYQGRTATRDITLHGRTIPAGERVILVTGAANRDEREYADADTFVVDREPHVALGFGHGVHFCLGAALARMESRVGLEESWRASPTTPWTRPTPAASTCRTSTASSRCRSRPDPRPDLSR